MNTELNTRVLLRSDTTANWNTNKSKVLLKGEVGIEFFTNGEVKIKIGDGTTTWENLSYFNDEIKLSGDGKSIEIDSDGTVKVYGFDTAETGAQPRKKADGSIEWVKPDTTTVEGIQVAVSGLQSDVSTLQSDVSGLKSNVSTLQSNVSTIQSDVSGLQSNVSTLQEEKANASDVYKKAETYSKSELDGMLGGAFHYKGSYTTFSALTADITNGTITPAKGDVWNIQTAGGTDYSGVSIKAGDNVAYNGSGWDVLSGTVDLSAYATKSELDNKVDKVEGSRLITSEEASKLAGIEAGADVNLIEGVQINGTDLSISGKKVNIPLGSSTPGVVISSDAENKVKIGSDGSMSLNSVNVNKLVQTVGDILILNGGSAS